MLEDYFDREIVYECQVLNDEREIRKKEIMRQFGVNRESLEAVDGVVQRWENYQQRSDKKV